MKKSLLILTIITSISLQPNLHAISMYKCKKYAGGAAVVGAIIGLVFVQAKKSSLPTGWKKYAAYAAAALVGGALGGGATGLFAYQYTPQRQLTLAQKDIDRTKGNPLVVDNTLDTDKERQDKTREHYVGYTWPLPTAFERMGTLFNTLKTAATRCQKAATDAQEDNNAAQVAQANNLKAEAQTLKQNAQNLRGAIQKDPQYGEQTRDKARHDQKEREIRLKQEQLSLARSKEFRSWTHFPSHCPYHHSCPHCRRW